MRNTTRRGEGWRELPSPTPASRRYRRLQRNVLRKRGADESDADPFEQHMISATNAYIAGRETLRRHLLTPRVELK